jgi:hypothetical protein
MSVTGESWFGLAVVLLLGCVGQLAAEDAAMTNGRQLYVHPLDNLDSLEVRAGTAQVIEKDGGKVLELDGMVLVPDLKIENIGIEVDVLAEAPCYPGIAFRLAGLENFELAYAVPVASGQSDAIQYDPVFRGSNTWQLHAGPEYQKQATVPTGKWFTLRVDVVGERAAIRVDDQPPLVVERLSHGRTAGRFGLWTFRPALFRNLRVTSPRSLEALAGQSQEAPAGAIDAWWLVGTGTLAGEPSGVLNLNRYLPGSRGEVRLVRSFRVDDEIDLEVAFGFSDEVALSLDGEVLFEGSHTFSGFETEETRGWVRPGDNRLVHHISTGDHELEAVLRVTEPFGWGVIITLGGGDIHLLPMYEDASEPTHPAAGD